MRKLIERRQENLIVCDNPACDYKYHYNGTSDDLLLAFINVPCPKCGQNLLTPEDYLATRRLMKIVDRINKWFSWITIFLPKEKNATIEVNVHNGIKIKTPQQ